MIVLVLGIPKMNLNGPLRPLFVAANQAIIALLSFTEAGSRFLFGDLMNEQAFGYIFAFHVLPTIIFMSALMSVLYHLQIMPKIVGLLARGLAKYLKLSGAESLSLAANVFVGQTEAPLVIRPYLSSLTRSELFLLMTGGMATVAGGVLAAYVGLLKGEMPEIAGHLLTASLMSAPAAVLIAKIMLPEKMQALTGSKPTGSIYQSPHSNVIEAAADGASSGLKLAVNVGAMLLAFVALIAMINGLLEALSSWIQFQSWAPSALTPWTTLQNNEAKLSFELILSLLLSPLAWLLGIPWSEVPLAAYLIGEKIVLNEFVAYVHLSQKLGDLSEKSRIILSYSLCGFANFSSIAIQIGGISSLAPERRSEIAKFGLRSVLAGCLAAFSTGALAGLFF